LVLFMDEACLTSGRIFWQSQQPCLTRHNPSCYIYSLLPTLLCGQLSGWHCAGLLVILMARCTDLLCVFGGKATRNAGENHISTTGLQLTWHIRAENVSLPLTTIVGLDWVGLWLGLPGYWTSHQSTSPY
jgi:hypothetical protein